MPDTGSRSIHDRDDVLGAVLAGGAGSRVGGADKGLLPLCGRPLIEHPLERLRPQCGRLVIVANRNLDDYARYVPTVHDERVEHAGPLAGLVAAFGFVNANRHAVPRWLLTAPVDCPDPPQDLAARLRAALIRDAQARCASVRQAGRRQPLLALYRVGAEPEAWHASAQAALREHGSPSRWHVALNAIAVDFDGPGDAFHNLNWPTEFSEYEHAHVVT